MSYAKLRNLIAWCIPYVMIVLAVNCAIVLHSADMRRTISMNTEQPMRQVQLESELFEIPALEAPIVVIERESGTTTRTVNSGHLKIKVEEKTVVRFTDTAQREVHEAIELIPMSGQAPSESMMTEELEQEEEAEAFEAMLKAESEESDCCSDTEACEEESCPEGTECCDGEEEGCDGEGSCKDSDEESEDESTDE